MPRARATTVGLALLMALSTAATSCREGLGIDTSSPQLVPSTASSTTAEPAPPPRFDVVGTEIHGPSEGEVFVPVGVNLLGPDSFFNVDGVTAGHARQLRRVWGLNTVRLNACLPVGCPYSGVHNQNNDDLDALVAEYTGEGMVVIVAQHQVKPGHWPTEAELVALEGWWRDVAARHAGNQRVWFNLLNEPGSERPVPRRWLDLHLRLLRAIRSTGADNLVVVDGSQWGQDLGDGRPLPARDENSAILTWGDDIRAVDDRVVFSIHVYDQWGSPELSQEARDARLGDFIDRVHARGHALLIGEVGAPGGACCDREALGTASAYRVAPTRRVGLLHWHGQAADRFRLLESGRAEVDPSDLDDNADPRNLTWQGRLLWDLAHRG